MRTDRWTHMTKLLVPIRNFSKAPKNVQIEKPLWISSNLSFIKTQTCNGAGHHQKAYVFVKALQNRRRTRGMCPTEAQPVSGCPCVSTSGSIAQREYSWDPGRLSQLSYNRRLWPQLCSYALPCSLAWPLVSIARAAFLQPLHMPQTLIISLELNLHTVTLLDSSTHELGARGGVVVKALNYKPAGQGFDSRWCHWNFSVT